MSIVKKNMLKILERECLGFKMKKIKYDLKELKIGIKVEMEHTKSKTVAERIAKDHLRKHKNYYSIIKKAFKGRH